MRPHFNTSNPSRRHLFFDVLLLLATPSRHTYYPPLLLFLMAPLIDDEAATRTEADSRTGDVAATTRQAAEAELARLSTEANRLTAAAACARREADHAHHALANNTQDPSQSQTNDALVPSANAQAQTAIATLHVQVVFVLSIRPSFRSSS
jgi:hypothetical protein